MDCNHEDAEAMRELMKDAEEGTDRNNIPEAFGGQFGGLGKQSRKVLEASFNKISWKTYSKLFFLTVQCFLLGAFRST